MWKVTVLMAVCGILKSQTLIAPDCSPAATSRFGLTLLKVAQFKSSVDDLHCRLDLKPLSRKSHNLKKPS